MLQGYQGVQQPAVLQLYCMDIMIDSEFNTASVCNSNPCTSPPALLFPLQIQDKGFSVLREAGEYDDLLNRGRMDIMLDNESEKWKILAEGPRRDRPAWLARKTLHVTPLPSLPLDQPLESVTAAVPVQLPRPDEVWSIATHKVGV